MSFKSDDDEEDSEDSFNASEVDEDDMDNQLRAKERDHHLNQISRSLLSSPLIPKEQFDQLPDQVKEILKQQHAHYHNLVRKIYSEAQNKSSSSRRSQH